ncbi:MAG: hypothetical protein WBO09_02750 [Methylocystis silviterrae]|uniref:hypothetical protein n=1 Tax=Methylocystis silviterrae TaxID=2743612 RepID=UPI003C75E14F
MSAEILKEFLVAVGFKADEDGARKVGEHIRTMTLSAVALGASLESLAATAFAATARISKTYSDIFYQSRKVGDSAGNIKAFSHAVSQLGGTAEEAGATLEEFSRKISAGGPGQEKWLEQFIGQTRDAKGALRETSEMVDSLLHSKKFLASPEYLQRRYIEMAGISENVWRASKDPNWQRHIEDAKKFNDAIGLDPQELAKKGQAFTEELRAIWMRIGAIRDKFLLNLGFEEPLKKFKKYLDEHSGDILKNLNAFVDAVKPFVVAFTNAAIQVGEFASAIANKLGPDTTAWVIIAGLGLKFTGLATVITALVVPAISALGSVLAALMLGPSGVAIRAIAAIAGVSAGAAAAALGAGAAATLYPTPAGKGEDEKQRQENVKRDPDYYKPGHPGAPAEPQKKKSLWERGKQWFNDKIGIAPAEGRETVEGQKGGETPASTPLLDTISKAEGTAGRGDYNAVLGYGKYGSPDKPLTDMTLAEAYSFGRTVRARHGSSSAIGRYQIVGTTMKAAAEGLGLDWTKDRFDAATQDRMAMWIARKQGLDAWEGFKFHPELRARARQHMSQAATAAPQPIRQDAAPASPQASVPQRPEVAPQTPVHVPPIKLPDSLDAAPKYDYTKPGHPLIEPTTPKSSSPTTPQAPPHAVSPRPIGHTTSNSVRHGDVSLNPKTTINVTTPGDAGAAARAIAGVQTRVNADAIRNMQGAAH